MKKELFLASLRIFGMLIAFFMLGATSVSAQNTDCTLPENWHTLSWMSDVSSTCPTCYKGGKEKEWLANVERLYCLRLKQRNADALNERQAAIIDSLQQILRSGGNNNGNNGGGGNNGSGQPTIIIHNHIYGDTTNVNVKSDGGRDREPQTVEEDTLPKQKRWSAGASLGYMSGFHSGPIPNPCNCPHLPIGFNEGDGGFAVSTHISVAPDTSKRISLAGEGSATWARLNLPHGVKTAKGYPTLANLRVAAVFTPTLFGAELEVGPQLSAAHIGTMQASWIGLQGRLGGHYKLSEVLEVGLATNLSLSSYAWVKGDQASKAKNWGFEASATYKNIRGFMQFQKLYALRGEGTGGATVTAFTMGATTYF